MFLFRPYFSNYSNVGEQHLILFLRTNHVIKIVDIASLHGSGMAMSTKKIPDFKSFFKYLKQNSNKYFCLSKCATKYFIVHVFCAGGNPREAIGAFSNGIIRDKFEYKAPRTGIEKLFLNFCFKSRDYMLHPKFGRV
jgi:hypothetical protein